MEEPARSTLENIQVTEIEQAMDNRVIKVTYGYSVGHVAPSKSGIT